MADTESRRDGIASVTGENEISFMAGAARLVSRFFRRFPIVIQVVISVDQRIPPRTSTIVKVKQKQLKAERSKGCVEALSPDRPLCAWTYKSHRRSPMPVMKLQLIWSGILRIPEALRQVATVSPRD